jgi:hypothetical protein
MTHVKVFRHRLRTGIVWRRAAAMPGPNSHDNDDEGGSGGGGGSPAKRIISLVGHGPGYKGQMREAGGGGGAGMRNEDGSSAGEVRGGAASGLDNRNPLRGPRYKDQMREAGVGETAADSDNSLWSLADNNKNRGTNNQVAAVSPAASVGLPVAVPIGDSVILVEQQEERLLEAERRAHEAERQRVEAEQVLQQSQRNKKRARYFLAVLALLGAAAATGVCRAGHCRSRPNDDSGTTRRAPTTASPTQAATPAPSKAPTPLSEEARSVLEYINTITLTGRNLTYPDQESPEGLALQWLIDKDKIGGTTSDLALLWLRQRYVLFTLSFQGDNAENNLFGRGHSVRLECEWEHVTCDGSFEGVVESLDFNGSNAQGRIPDDIGLLTSLTYLDFSGTRMAGTIPSSLARLTALTDVRWYNSQFTGTVPFCSDNSVNQTFVSLAADCDKVDCPCCTHCCPGSDGDIPAIPSNWSIQCGA